MDCDCGKSDLVPYSVGNSVPIQCSLVSEKTGVAFGLTGLKAAVCDVLENKTDPEAIFSLSLEDEEISVADATGSTTGGAASLLNIAPTVVQSALLTPGRTYVCRLVLTLADDAVLTLWFYVHAES